MNETTTHALYRFFDTGGDLLYIGITNNPGRRWGQHASDKPWWNEVDRIELERHQGRAAVLEAERAAILAELPRYNVQHVAPIRPATTAPVVDVPPIGKCAHCERPAVFILVRHMDIADYRRALTAWNAEVDKASPGGIRVVSGSLFLSHPDKAAWTRYCEQHLDESGNAYGFKIPSTWQGWISKTAHLMGKSWLECTNWRDVLGGLSIDWEPGRCRAV